MKLTAQIKLLPSEAQQASLQCTLERANTACNFLAALAWEEQLFSKYLLQTRAYYEVRERFGLSAQMTLQCIVKVAYAYEGERTGPRTFRPCGAMGYNDRILSWNIAARTISIWTVDGRQTIPFVAGKQAMELLEQRRGESDLCLVDGSFYLYATCEVDAAEPQMVTSYLGVDLGMTNVAVDSDGEVHSGAKVNGLRRRHRRLRAKLQGKGTRSAKRRLKKRRHKEARFAKDVNHQISKRLVVKAQGTGRGIALEELGGIRERVTVGKSQRATFHSWSFYQLRSFVEYKCQRAGIPVVAVDPRNTSRTCPACGCVDKRNRPSQSRFLCVACGFSAFADHVAAGNIARRAAGCPLGELATHGGASALAASYQLRSVAVDYRSRFLTLYALGS